jgi:predicted phosphodiesterase
MPLISALPAGVGGSFGPRARFPLMPLSLDPTSMSSASAPLPLPNLSRRDFLAGLTLTGAGLAIGGCGRRAGSRGNPDGWFAWLSDVHLSADTSLVKHGQNLTINLRTVIDEILDADDPPRAVIIAGDLALESGTADDYAAILTALAPVRAAGIPIHAVLGNHDHRERLAEAFGTPDGFADTSSSSGLESAKRTEIVEMPGLRLVLLDSLIETGKTGGELGEAQRDWLARSLDERPDMTTLVVLHHNLNTERPSALHDTAGLLEIVAARPQVRAVLFGHTHCRHAFRRDDGLHLVNLPAVGYKFLRTQPLGWTVLRPFPDGAELETRPIGRDRRKFGVTSRDLRWRTG